MRCSLSVVTIIILSCMLGAPMSLHSRTIYVAPKGDDRNAGASTGSPLGSINTALSYAGAGDTVCLLPGRYRELVRFRDKHGRPEEPLCVMGVSDDSAGYPVIDGGAPAPSSEAAYDWMTFERSSWIEIANIRFINGWTFPIKVNASSYLTFRRCSFRGGKRVINAEEPETHHLLVEECSWDQGGDYLWRVEYDSAGVPAWLSMHHMNMSYFNGSLIDFHGTGGSMVIRRNTIMNAFQAVRFRGEKGFDANVEIYENHVSNMRDNDFEPEYYAYNLHIYHNRSHNVHKTLSVDNVEGGRIYYYGNTVTADTDAWSQSICTGIWKLYGRPRMLSYPLYAFNNSFYTAGVAFLTMHGPVMYLRHYNNAYYFMKDSAWDLNEWSATDEFDNDIANKPWPKNLVRHGEEAHGRIGDILFSDPGNGDLRLRPSSPGIDAGRVVSIPEFTWRQPYSGKAPDVGAYEDGRLVEGPPFRIMCPPGVSLPYREKPRIVRHAIFGKKMLLYFSDPLDPSSIAATDLCVYERDTTVPISAVHLSDDRYALTIDLERELTPVHASLAFVKYPVGMNGEKATSWASTIPVRRWVGTEASR